MGVAYPGVWFTAVGIFSCGTLYLCIGHRQTHVHRQARVVAEVGRILEVAARQANACRDAADQLAYLHSELEAGHVPAYDVASALTVLRTGKSPLPYPFLPVCASSLRPLSAKPEPCM